MAGRRGLGAACATTDASPGPDRYSSPDHWNTGFGGAGPGDLRGGVVTARRDPNNLVLVVGVVRGQDRLHRLSGLAPIRERFPVVDDAVDEVRAFSREVLWSIGRLRLTRVDLQE